MFKLRSEGKFVSFEKSELVFKLALFKSFKKADKAGERLRSCTLSDATSSDLIKFSRAWWAKVEEDGSSRKRISWSRPELIKVLQAGWLTSASQRRLSDTLISSLVEIWGKNNDCVIFWLRQCHSGWCSFLIINERCLATTTRIDCSEWSKFS